MENKKYLFIALLILAAVIAILFYNKSRNEIISQSDILTTVPVTVKQVTKQKLSEEKTLIGIISANNDIAIISETQGKVVGVDAEIGQYLNSGSLIVRIDDELKKVNYLTAETNYEKAKKDLERFESLYKQNSATDQQLEGTRLGLKSAEAQYIVAKRQYNDTKITSPISGVLTSRPVDVGMYVASGMVVANVIDISTLKVKTNVPEQDVFNLKVGQKMNVQTDIYPGVLFHGIIKSISSKADEAHTYPVEIVFSNSKTHPLKAGMFGRINYTSHETKNMLTVPREALIGSAKSPKVFIVENGIARLREIVIATESGISLAISAGLKEGETVVVNGQNNLKDSVEVTVLK
ncbi:MAG: efflux RND transporter periplasmic adaptor subunit [Ignavibacteriales bacterium]|nr:efflux RND transporter periplasmic adaptor subunit [Ignavibacteriales bacterium]